MYLEYGTDMFRMLDAEYALILYDAEKKKYIAARDPIGIRPLYYGVRADGTYIFASEPKNLTPLVEKIFPFPPGHYFEDGKFIKYRDMSGGAASGKILSRILKSHGEAALRLLALDDGLDLGAEKSLLSPSSLPGRVLALLGDGAVTGLFGSAAAESVVRGSSAASENGTGSHPSPSSSGG